MSTLPCSSQAQVTVVKPAWTAEAGLVPCAEADKNDNVLVNAPHPEYEVVADTWEHSYTRQKAAYPIESVRDNKFWVNVARVDNTLGDRKLLPTCYGCFE
jgi:glycine dehydrogenase